MDNEEFYKIAQESNKSISEMIADRQQRLFDDGYGRDTDFWQKTCWNKAVEEIRAIVKDNPLKPLDSKVLLSIRTKLKIDDYKYDIHPLPGKEEKEESSSVQPPKKKRGRPKKTGALVQSMETFVPVTEEPVKRKRGRPRKNPLPIPVDPLNPTVKRKRGRPRKNPSLMTVIEF